MVYCLLRKQHTSPLDALPPGYSFLWLGFVVVAWLWCWFCIQRPMFAASGAFFMPFYPARPCWRAFLFWGGDVLVCHMPAPALSQRHGAPVEMNVIISRKIISYSHCLFGGSFSNATPAAINTAQAINPSSNAPAKENTLWSVIPARTASAPPQNRANPQIMAKSTRLNFFQFFMENLTGSC